MRTLRRIAIARLVLAAAIGAAPMCALAQSAENAFADAIRRANPETSLRDYYADRALNEQVYRSTLSAGETRDWSSPFTNTIAIRSRYSSSLSSQGVRKCTCYLPENIRGWGGGPLTQGEIIELCWRQCF